MRFDIGDIVHHAQANEEGRIVRLFKSGNRIAYVVATTNRVCEREIEALWFPYEIKEIAQRARRPREMK
jgi:hypothetical protein